MEIKVLKTQKQSDTRSLCNFVLRTFLAVLINFAISL